MDEEETTENNIRQASATTMPCTPSSSSLAKGQSSSKQQRGVEGAQSPEAFSNALQSPIRHDNDMTPSFASGTSEHQAPTFRKYVDQLTVKLYVEWDGTPGLRLAPLQSWQCATDKSAPAFVISNPPGCLRGVKKGDVLLEIGSRDVRNLSFQKTEELLKTTMKPVHLVFERTFRMSGEINFGNEHHALHEIVEQARELMIVHGDYRQIQGIVPDKNASKRLLNDKLQELLKEIQAYKDSQRRGYDEDFLLDSLRDEASYLNSQISKLEIEKAQLKKNLEQLEQQKQLTLYASKGVQAEVQQMASAYESLTTEQANEDRDQSCYRGWGTEQIVALRQLNRIREKLRTTASTLHSVRRDSVKIRDEEDSSKRVKCGRYRSMLIFAEQHGQQMVVDITNQLIQLSNNLWFLQVSPERSDSQSIASFTDAKLYLESLPEFEYDLNYDTETDMKLMRDVFRVLRCNLLKLAQGCHKVTKDLEEKIDSIGNELDEEEEEDL